VSAATVTFKDLLSGKVLASGVKVSQVSNTDTSIGTANTVVTLSSGKYGAQQYLIEVTLGGSYKNDQQTGAAVGTEAYEAAHALVTVMIPATKNTMQGAASLSSLPTAAGIFGKANASYVMGMTWTNKGTNPQGQVTLTLNQNGVICTIKSNSITSLAFSGAGNKYFTLYTKSSLSCSDGSYSEGNVTLRVDAHDGGESGDTIGFTVLSSKNSALYYSNNWIYNTPTKAWQTVQQGVGPATAVVIN
jgi:hypothetical protein